MKTAMQKLIDRIKQLKYSEINEQAWDAYDSVMDLAESLLNEEKKQIIDAFEQGENNSVDYFIPANNIKESEQYYNETFNKEI